MPNPSIRTILIIDDDDDLRGLIQGFLEGEGYSVTTAANGETGFRKFSSGDFDLVITDIVMPDKEGLETIMDIKNLNPSQRLIAISGGGYVSPQEYLQYAREFGANAALKKPFTIDQLRAVLDDL